MQRLILMRHGQAERPGSGLEDFDRALDAEGRAEARAIGQALSEAGYAPDLGLVSGARRTLETWKCVAEAFPEARLQPDDSLYAASSARLALAARDAGAGAGTVMLVGHNPGIHQLALHLARQAGASPEQTRPLYERFPTGSAAVFKVAEDGSPTFERLFLAKTYRRAAE